MQTRSSIALAFIFYLRKFRRVGFSPDSSRRAVLGAADLEIAKYGLATVHYSTEQNRTAQRRLATKPEKEESTNQQRQQQVEVRPPHPNVASRNHACSSTVTCSLVLALNIVVKRENNSILRHQQSQSRESSHRSSLSGSNPHIRALNSPRWHRLNLRHCLFRRCPVRRAVLLRPRRHYPPFRVHARGHRATSSCTRMAAASGRKDKKRRKEDKNGRKEGKKGRKEDKGNNVQHHGNEDKS